MQHKRRKPYGKLLLLVPGVILVGGLVALMTMDVPVQQKPVQQALDAKTFLETKPEQ